MPVHVVTGEDHYRLQQAVKAVRGQIVSPELAALSHRHLKNPDWSELAEAVGAVTFSLGGNTLIEVEGFIGLTKATSDPQEDYLADELKTLLNTLDPSKYVLFVAPKLDRKIRFPKWLCSQSFVKLQDFKAIPNYKPEEAIAVILQEAKTLAIPLERDAAVLLVDGMGTDIQTLVNEIQKLSVFTAGKPVTRDVVRTMSPHNENTFAMLGLWVSGQQRQKTLMILEELLLHESILRLFALLQTYIGDRYAIRLWMSLGQNPRTFAERLKKHPFVVEKTVAEAMRIPMERWQTLKHLVTEMEYQLKTGQINDRLALERVLCA